MAFQYGDLVWKRLRLFAWIAAVWAPARGAPTSNDEFIEAVYKNSAGWVVVVSALFFWIAASDTLPPEADMRNDGEEGVTSDVGIMAEELTEMFWRKLRGMGRRDTDFSSPDEIRFPIDWVKR